MWRKALEHLGSLRSAARLFTRKTGRWFLHGDEELVFAYKNLDGEFIAELAHQIRRPKNHEPLYTKHEVQANGVRKLVRKRQVDLYYQHTPSLLYNLSKSSHARAFGELLRYSIAFTAGHDHPGRFPHLYRMKIGETKELGRWPISDLHHYRKQSKKILPVKHGFEILEAVCGPGERPRKPDTLCRPRPVDKVGAEHYNKVKAHWYKQLEACTSTQIMLRVRRVCVDSNGRTKPAFYLKAVYDFDLPLQAIRSLAKDFPAFWSDMYKQYYVHANTPPQALRKAKLCGTWQEDRKRKHEAPPAYLSGAVWAHRQPRWNHDIVHDWLHPTDVEKLCQLIPQPGLFLCDWVADVKRNSPEYFRRVALYQAGFIAWNPKWSATEDDVELDTFRLRTKYKYKFTRLVYVFLLLASMKMEQRKQGQAHYGSEKFLHDVVRLYNDCLARAPPITLDNHGGW